jgi:predicted O-linked N-acetylglucosamine transferase (SPINDLY family)/cephalosporin hydroxylase
MLNAEQDAISWFHKLYYESGQKGDTWNNTRWMGVPILKCPLDLWIYQEILFEIKPELIIECGTFSGGSALFLAHLCDIIGCGEIVSIDIEQRSDLPQHPRIYYWSGSSISEQIVERVRQKASCRCRVLVILDSDHRANHVLQELRLYSAFVTPGSYVIVEDTNVNGHPVAPDFGPGPMEAVQAFLSENPSFSVDPEREKFGLTFNPSGYLKRGHPEAVMPQLSANINQSLPHELSEIKQKLQIEILRLDLGCGTNKSENFVGVDIHPGSKADIIADLNQRFPFPDSSVDEVRAHDSIEHLSDKIHTMQEIWRICKPGAKVDIRVPSTDGRGAFQDPTHVSFWNINSFLYYCVDFPPYLELCKTYGFQGAFKVKRLENEESPGGIIHVIAELEVVKQQSELIRYRETDKESTFLETLLESIDREIKHYYQKSTNSPVIESIRKLRKQVAESCLNFPEEQLEESYLKGWSKAHQLLLNSGIKTEPLTQEEQNFASELVAHITGEFDRPRAIHYLLAAMLYYRVDQLPLQHDLPRIPLWFLNDYLKLVLYSPQYFQEVGEADSYYCYMQQWIDHLHTSIFSNTDSAFWRNVAVQFLQLANFIPIYFNEANLKDIYVKRAEILEHVIKMDGHEINYDFTTRDSKRKKIRLGILASHFTPAAETFASLPIYEYISRDFEVILYSLSRTGDRLEQYCQSCANSFKLLPQNLKEQVNCIRADDLDFLFIATNVTAGTNQICLLSLHRLARVQVTSIASIITTGIRNIDYYVSGKLTDQSPEAEHHYREQLLQLDGSAHCFSYGSEQNTATVRIDRKKLGISEKSVVFVSVANMFKITPELSHTWAKIIASVPNSVLLLFPFGPNWSKSYPKKTFLNNIDKIFSEYSLQQSRCITLDPVPVPNRDDIKEYLKLADVYLDSYPFSGTTSLIEPLEVGLPIVARQGTYLRSAMGAALLQDIGMHDLVANSEESYIQLAIALGTEPELRKQKSDQIEQKMQGKPKFLDSRSYSAQMGALFQELLRKYQANALGNELKLRDINLIIFPDWSQPEESISEALASAIRAIVTHPDKSHITLLIDTSKIADEDAELALSSIVMNLMMEEDLDVTDGPEISPIAQLSEMQWQALLSRLHARIVWENGTPQAITYPGVNNLPILELNHFSSKRVVQLNNGSWSLESAFSN